jgi:glycosyltransferase involved in cell wall biosynthesis
LKEAIQWTCSMPSSLKEAVRSATCLVIPAYNEEPSIGTVLSELTPLWSKLVVVDDGSSDRTAAVARASGARVLVHPVNRGQGAALQTGLQWGLDNGAEYFVTFDADGQHSHDNIDRLLEPLISGEADVALGSRFLGSSEGVSLSRLCLLKAAVLFTRLSTGLHLTDTHNGLRALTRDAASKIEITIDRMAHASEILDQIARHRLRFVEVPVEIRYTDYSTGKGQHNLGAAKVLADYMLNRVLR